MGEQWPSLRGRELDRILRRICGEPIHQKGSHRTFRNVRGTATFTFSYHDRDDIRGYVVRRILVSDAGLTSEQARKALRQ